MKQALGSGEDLDKGPKIHNPFYLSKIYLAEFCFCSNTGYYIHSLFCRFPIRRGYVDKSAVVYIYLYPCLFYDSPDNLPARAYDVSNLILFNLHGVNSRGIRCKVFTWFSNCFTHLVKDKESSLSSLFERLFKHLMRYTAYLCIQLECCYPFLCSGYLEVHISKVVLKTKDISKNNNLVSFFHQTHCNASNMGLDRDPCIHQSKGTTAYRCHGR